MLINASKAERIPIQYEAVSKYSGTDADVIFASRGGVATAMLSIPNRYMHTPVEMIQLSDAEYVVNLLVAFCENLEEDANFVI